MAGSGNESGVGGVRGMVTGSGSSVVVASPNERPTDESVEDGDGSAVTSNA